MSCPDLYFSPKFFGFTTAITISTPLIMNNLETTISVTLYNDSGSVGRCSVALYWAGVNRRGLDTPQAITTPLLDPIPAQTIGGTDPCQFTYRWLPDSQVTSDPVDPFQIAIVAQAVAVPVAGGDCDGWWNSSNFDLAQRFNAAQAFPFIALPFGSFAFDAVTSRREVLLAEVASKREVALAEIASRREVGLAEIASRREVALAEVICKREAFFADAYTASARPQLRDLGSSSVASGNGRTT